MNGFQKQKQASQNTQKDVQLHMHELKTILEIDKIIGDEQKPKRQIKKYPSLQGLTKIDRKGRDFYFGIYRIGTIEIELIEDENFDNKQLLVKEIRKLLYGFIFQYIDKSPWSIAETLLIIIALYDHEIRDEQMQKNIIVTDVFYNQFCKSFNLRRNLGAYRRKIGEVKLMNLSLQDLQTILNFVEINIKKDPNILNQQKLFKTNAGIIFENKDSSIIQWSQFKQDDLYDPNYSKHITEKRIRTHALRDSQEQSAQSSVDLINIKDERYLNQIQEQTGLSIEVVRQLWQQCRMDMKTLIDQLIDMLNSGNDDSEEDDLVEINKMQLN